MKRDEIVKNVADEGVKFIKLMFTDALGAPKVIEVYATSLADVLDNKMLTDGSNMKGFTKVSSADVILAPDYSSYRRLPMYDSEFGAVAMFMCDVLGPDRKPLEGCTRSRLKAELEKLKNMGFSKMNVGFEPEFFLLTDNPKGKAFETILHDEFGYNDPDSIGIGARVRREIMHEMVRVGISPITSHHEAAPSQHEISYKYADALAACDNLIVLRLIVGDIAKKNGLFATFSPKPMGGVNGSGLHTHISLVGKDGKNAFMSSDGLSDNAKYFIAGVLAHSRALCGLTNPSEESYRRLVPGYEAPVSVCWGYHNRSAMIRIPIASGAATRIEVRNPDNSSNPYLATVGTLRAGLDGIAKAKMPPDAVGFNAWHDKSSAKIATLPVSLAEALDELAKSPLLKDLIIG